jgi:hypothetical protein
VKDLFLIYGDSFCDPLYCRSWNLNSDHHRTYDTWYELLSRHGKVKNHGVQGAGLFRAMRALFQHIVKYQNIKTHFIIFLTYHTRFDFPNSNHASQHVKINDDNTAIYFDGDKPGPHPGDDKINKYYEWFLQIRPRAHGVFEYNKDITPFLTDMLISYMHNYCNTFEGKKVMIISVPEYKSRIRLPNSDKFYFNPDLCMEDVHLEEYTEDALFYMKEKREGYDFEGRRNHLSNRNHEVLYKNLEKFFIDGEIDLEWNFHKNFYNGPTKEPNGYT